MGKLNKISGVLKIPYQFYKIQVSRIDIDYLKKINDEYGHIIGDKALKFLSNVFKFNIRKDDIFCRWGGE